MSPLSEGADGIQKAVDTLQSYNLLRDDLDSLIELTKWPGQKDINASIDSRVIIVLKIDIINETILRILIFYYVFRSRPP